MKVAFRVDASLEMGIGHVMRCLTLADALSAEGAQCHFVCREHPGHLLDLIAQRGHRAHPLPLYNGRPYTENVPDNEPGPAHAAWLGCGWQNDYERTHEALSNVQPDWLIVDHYALDFRWERRIRSICCKIMVIDDLADRMHDCDLLLDQNFGRAAQDYNPLVPTSCVRLTGSKYALLRPEFAALRDYSLLRRENLKVRHILISMGGVDNSNSTGKVLQALRDIRLPEHCRITVVMGGDAPWLDEVKVCARTLPCPIEVKVNVDDMAQLMADSDLAIGAAGSTSWERCCLGLPTIVMIIAENQKIAARQLEKTGAIILLDSNWQPFHLKTHLGEVCSSQAMLYRMALCSSKIVDGKGVKLVLQSLLQ